MIHHPQIEISGGFVFQLHTIPLNDELKYFISGGKKHERKTAYNEKCSINGNVWCPCRCVDVV